MHNSPPLLRLALYSAAISGIIGNYAFALAALWQLGTVYCIAGLVPFAAISAYSFHIRAQLRRKTAQITQLQASQAQLHESMRHLIQTERLVAVGTLAAGVAHEFNNLLAAIAGRAESAVDGNLKQQAQALSHIAQLAQNGGRITYSLLAFARQTPHQKITTSIHDAIEPAIGLIEMEAKRLQIEIHRQFQPVPVLCLDVDLISQAIMHLMTNALDAMQPAGGGRLTIGCNQQANEVCIWVSDTGSGIPDTIRERIFEPFVTTKRTSTSSHGGSGMGLAFAFGVVNDHGGRIEVASQVGRGTTMMIYLPIPIDQSVIPPADRVSFDQGAVSLSTPLEQPTVPYCTLNVIVVDDEPIIAHSLADMIERRGHRVQCFQHPEHLLADVVDSVDVVFSDKAMPALDGLRLLNHIRAKLPHATLALVTGYIDDSDVARAESMGIHVIHKPFSPLSIQHILQLGMAAKSVRRSASMIR